MAGATCVMATMAAAHAEAGTYHVLACSNKGSTSAPIPNNSWTQVPASPPTGLEAFVSCPPQARRPRRHRRPRPHPRPSRATPGPEVFWRFGAPAGTSITGISVVRSLGKAGVQSWRPFGRADGAVFDTCDIAAGQDVCENTGNATFAINDASTIDYGVRCDAPSGQCASGSSLHTVWMSLYAADVLVTDPSAPTLTGGPSGPLWNADGYHRAPRPPASAAPTTRGSSRRTGSSTAANRPRIAAAATTRGRFRAPNMPPTRQHSMNMGAFRDGQHQLQAVVKDAAGNAATAGPITITIDNTPPAPPGRLTAVPAGDGSFTASWTNPDGQTAPITKAHYKLLPGRVRRRTVPRRTNRDGQQHLLDHRTARPGSGVLGPDRLARGRRRQRRHRQHRALDPGRRRAHRLGRHHVRQGQARSPPSAGSPRQGRRPLTDKLEIRYRYRPGQHHKLRSVDKNAAVHRGAYVAHLKLPRAARRTHKGTAHRQLPRRRHPPPGQTQPTRHAHAPLATRDRHGPRRPLHLGRT